MGTHTQKCLLRAQKGVVCYLGGGGVGVKYCNPLLYFGYNKQIIFLLPFYLKSLLLSTFFYIGKPADEKTSRNAVEDWDGGVQSGSPLAVTEAPPKSASSALLGHPGTTAPDRVKQVL